MSFTIENRREQKRGCGYRSGGGLYLVASSEAAPCGRLPLELGICPTCRAGIKPSRGWTWVNGKALFAGQDCKAAEVDPGLCRGCYLREIGQAGLLWIDEKYYSSGAAFMREAVKLGISRRIPAIPRGFEIDETIVLLAHRKGIEGDGDGADGFPAIFAAFRPTRIEYVVKGDESDEELQALADRGITLVRVFPIADPGA